MSNASMGSSRNHATSWANPLLPQFVLAQETIFDFWNIQMVKQIADFLVPGRRVGPLIWREIQQLDSCNFPNVVLVKCLWSKPWYPGEHQNSWDLWMFIPPHMVYYTIVRYNRYWSIPISSVYPKKSSINHSLFLICIPLTISLV